MKTINLNIADNLSVTLSPHMCGVSGCAKYTIMNNKIWILVPKNGCSTIAFCSAIHNNAIDPNCVGSTTTVDWIGFNKNTTIIPNRLIIDFDLPRIAFYRDPIDRFCSLINYAYSSYYGLQNVKGLDYPALFDNNLEHTIQNFAIYCSIANMFYNVDSSDQHAVSQSRYLDYCGTKNLTLYHLKDLKKVFAKEGIKHHTINESSKRLVSREDIPDYIVDQLKYIYRDDYNLEKLIQQVDA